MTAIYYNLIKDEIQYKESYEIPANAAEYHLTKIDVSQASSFLLWSDGNNPYTTRGIILFF